MPDRHNYRSFLALFALLLLTTLAFADNKVLGELDLQGATKVEKDSGVWIDGQYVGYLKELKGDKKILLLPGEHDVVVKQDGYEDFRQNVLIQPGEKQILTVKMTKDLRFQMPKVFSEIKLNVNPNRAAVFVDGLFVGHVGDFDGIAHSLLVAPGHRKVTISLPGYDTFQTEIDLAPNQKYQLKTNLLKSAFPTSPNSSPD